MNIIKENVDELNAVLKVKVGPEDYKLKYESALKNYSKKAQIPGFRPGKVPAGLIKKMHGKSILVDEINRLLNDTVYNYISENKIEILGNPLPNLDASKDIDWDNQQEFEFLYELGLAPQFNIELGKDKVDFYEIKVDDSVIDKYQEDIAKRYGKIVPTEVSGPSDMLFGDLVELDANGEILAGGIFRSSSLFLERYKDSAAAKALIGVKKDDKVTIDLKELSDSAADIAAMLGIDKTAVEQLTSKFQFTVKNISSLQPSDINEELFNKVYGEGVVKTTEEFRSKVKEEISKMYARESEQRFYNDAVESIMKKVTIKLPDEFLKRWLVAVNEKPVTYEQVSKEYEQYADSLKWQLIENKILKDNEIKVSSDEAADYVRGLVADQMKRYGQQEIDKTVLEDTVKRVLADEKESKRVFDQLYSAKLIELFKNKIPSDKKQVSFEEFGKK